MKLGVKGFFFIHLFFCLVLSLFYSGASCLQAAQLISFQPMPKEAEAVLLYWLGPVNNDFDFPDNRMSLWFKDNSSMGEEMRTHFEPLLQMAAEGKLNNWKAIPRARLALIILLDQFPRKMYPDSPLAFAYDSLAQRLALEAISLGYDKHLTPLEKVFLYMPFLHAESLPLQKKSVILYGMLIKKAPKEVKSKYKYLETYAENQFAIIDRFKRFPERNELLGRVTTPSEREYLKQKN